MKNIFTRIHELQKKEAEAISRKEKCLQLFDEGKEIEARDILKRENELLKQYRKELDELFKIVFGEE